MKIRILAAAAAVILAIIGAIILSGYVASADERALRGAKAVEVFLVRAPVPTGSTTDEVALLVSQQAVPANAVAEGAVTDLAQITGKVPSTDLVPGEQLLEGRFVDPASLNEQDAGQVPLPDGMQEVTIQLEPQRVLGGQLAAGDTVGVLFSFTIDTKPTTHLEMHKVLVMSVQGAPAAAAPSTGSGQAGAAPAMPAGTLLVTLALMAPDVEKIVYAGEFGKTWLSKEPSTATESGTRELTLDGIFK